MSTLTTLAKFNAVVPVNGGFSEDTPIQSFIEQAEQTYLVPLIGQAFYDELKALQQPNDKQVLLLDKIYRAVGFTALWLYLPFGQVQLSSSGIQIVTSGDRKTAFEWQVNQVEKQTARFGMDGLEDVLAYLEANLNDFTTYKNSDERKTQIAGFINSADDFNSAYIIGRSRLTYSCLLPLIRQVESERIAPLLGEAGTMLRSKLMDGTVLADADRKLLRGIRNATAYLTIMDAIPQLGVEISPSGLSVNYLSALLLQYKSPASDNRIEALLSHVKEKAAGYLAELPTLVPGYVAPTGGEVYNIDNSNLNFFCTF